MTKRWKGLPKCPQRKLASFIRNKQDFWCYPGDLEITRVFGRNKETEYGQHLYVVEFQSNSIEAVHIDNVWYHGHGDAASPAERWGVRGEVKPVSYADLYMIARVGTVGLITHRMESCAPAGGANNVTG